MLERGSILIISIQKTGTLVYIDTTKTYAGTRVIPMQDDVYEAFELHSCQKAEDEGGAYD